MLFTINVNAGGKAPRQARAGLALACQQGASQTLMQAMAALLQVSLQADCSVHAFLLPHACTCGDMHDVLRSCLAYAHLDSRCSHAFCTCAMRQYNAPCEYVGWGSVAQRKPISLALPISTPHACIPNP